MDPKLIGAFILAIAFEILMPVAVALWLRRRYGVPWRVFGYGALIFLVFQIATRIQLVQVLQFALAPQLSSSEALAIAWLVFLSITAGIFEETGRYIGYRYLLKDARTWSNALMYGAGHGGLESALLVGGLAALTLIQGIAIQAIDPSQVALPAEQVEQIRQAQEVFQKMAWWLPLLGAYERLMAMTLHLALSVIVLQVFLRGSLAWLGAAIGYHGAANLAVVFVARQAGPLWAEGVLTILAVFNLYLILRLRRSPERSDDAAARPAGPAP